MAWQLAALAGAQLLSGALAGKSEKEQAKAEAKTLERQGKERKRLSLKEADVIRRTGTESKSSAQADLAARGFDLTAGTAGLIMDEYAKRIEYDAQQAIMEGTLAEQNALYESKQIKKLGKDRAQNAMLSSVISAGSTLYGGK